MRSKIAFTNSFYAVVLQVIIAAFGFITPRLIIGNYGSELNGLVSSISEILKYFNLLEVGLSGAAVYELYKPLKDKDYEKINKIVTFASKYYKKIGFIIVAGLLLLAPLYTLYIVNTSLSNLTVFSLFIILGIAAAFEFLIMSRCRIILTADQRGYIISIVMILSTLAQQILMILMILSHAPIQIVYLVPLVMKIIRGVILNYIVTKVYHNKVSFQSNFEGFTINTQKYVFIHEIFYTVNNALPLVFINIYYNLNVASIYTVYNMPVVMINLILSTLYQSITASYGNLVVENKVERENKVYESFQFIYLWLSSWIIGVMAFLLSPFVLLYTADVTNVDYNMPVMGYMLVIFSVANCIRVVFALPNSAHGFFKETHKSPILNTLLSIGISFLGGYINPAFVLLGPIFGFVMNGLYQMMYLLRNSGLETTRALKNILNLVIIVFISIKSTELIKPQLNSFAEFVIWGFSIFIIIGIITSILFCLTNRKKVLDHFKYVKRMFGL